MPLKKYLTSYDLDLITISLNCNRVNISEGNKIYFGVPFQPTVGPI